MARLILSIVAAALFLGACGPLPTESAPPSLQDIATPASADILGGAASGAGG